MAPPIKPVPNVALAHAQRKANQANAKTTPSTARKKRSTPVRVGAPPSVRSSGRGPVSEEAASKDYTDAHTYLTDYYGTYVEIAEDLWDAAHIAVNSFFITTTMPVNNLHANIAYQLIRVALGVLPLVSPVAKLFEAMRASKELATKQLSGTAVVLQRTASGAFTQLVAQGTDGHRASLSALDHLSKLATAAKAVVLEERDSQRKALNAFASERPDWRGRLYSYVLAVLPSDQFYDPAEIAKFQQKYEIDLYKSMYGSNAHVQELQFCYLECTSQGLSVQGIPTRVLDRLVQLTGAATHLAAVQSWNLPKRYALTGGGGL